MKHSINHSSKLKNIPLSNGYNNYGNPTIMGLESLYHIELRNISDRKNKSFPINLIPKTSYHHEMNIKIKSMIENYYEEFIYGLPYKKFSDNKEKIFAVRDKTILSFLGTDESLIEEIVHHEDPCDKIICAFKTIIPEKFNRIKEDLIVLAHYCEEKLVRDIAGHYLRVLKGRYHTQEGIKEALSCENPWMMSYNALGIPLCHNYDGFVCINRPNLDSFVINTSGNIDLETQETTINNSITKLIPSPSFRILTYYKYDEVYYILQILPDPGKYTTLTMMK